MRFLHRVGAVLALLAAYACGPTPATAATQFTALPAISAVTDGVLFPCQISGVTYACTAAQIIAYANLGALQPLDADLSSIAAASSTNALYYRAAAGSWSPVTFGSGITFSGGALGLGAITPSSVAATGTVTGSNLSGTNTGDQTSVSGNAGTATKLATARALTITGDIAWSATFDGSAAVSAAGTLATVNANVGSFGSTSAVPILTVNAKGLVTAVGTAALGTAATANTGTSGSTVPLLSGANTWSGAQTFSTNVQLGTSTSTGSAAPLYLDMGGTFSSTAGANSKLRVYDAGGNIYGFGVSSSQFDYMGPTGASHVFYIAGTEVGRINASGLTTTSGATFGAAIKMSAATTVSALSTCNAAARGTRTVVTDATAPTFLSTLTGGGSVVSPAFCNGTAWVAG